MPSATPLLSHTALRRGVAWVWGLVLALTMFTLSYPDCTRAADEPLALSVAGQMASASQADAEAQSSHPAASCPHPGSAAVADAVSDLPDFDLAPAALRAPGPNSRHAWVAAPAVRGQTAMAWLALRPPNA